MANLHARSAIAADLRRTQRRAIPDDLEVATDRDDAHSEREDERHRLALGGPACTRSTTSLNYTLTAIRFAARFKESLGPEMSEILADVEEGMMRIRDVITHLKNFAYPEKAGTESMFTLDEVFRSAQENRGR